MVGKLVQYLKKKVSRSVQTERPTNVRNWRENISVGERVSFGGEVYFGGGGAIAIGDDTMVAANVVFHTATHDYEAHPMWTWCVERPIEIGKHVWIGVGAIVLPGVKVGDYSVVGSGAVVNSHVPRGAIVAGNPARIIRYRDLEKIMTEKVVANKYPGVLKELGFLEEGKVCKESGGARY